MIAELEELEGRIQYLRQAIQIAIRLSDNPELERKLETLKQGDTPSHERISGWNKEIQRTRFYFANQQDDK